MHGCHFPDAPNIGSTEDQAIIHISLYCINERLGDAVGHFRRIAFFQAVVAFADGRLRSARPGMPTGL